MTVNIFDHYIKTINDQDYKIANIRVADSMFIGLAWFEQHGIDCTAADLLEYSKQVNAKMPE